MPKETFFNLPADKRAMICDVAIAEFAENAYDLASINRIVANAGIAKGSFYQYFADKEDLFFYLLQLIGEEKLNYISPVMQNPDAHNFFTLLREINHSGLRFAAEHPQYVELTNRLVANKDAPIYKKMLADNLPAAYGFFAELLEKAMVRGEIRDDIDIRMLAYLIASMNTHVIEYYVEFGAKHLDGQMMETIDSFLELLQFGIRKQGAPSSQSLEDSAPIDMVTGGQY